MKTIYFSRHARRRMRRYEISEEVIRSVLANPDHVGPTIKGRTNAIKREGTMIIRVTYKDEPHRLVVVTVTPRRKI